MIIKLKPKTPKTPDTLSPAYAKLLTDLDTIKKNKISDKEAQLIDDSDFKLAPNFTAFCLDYLNIKVYPKQIEIGSDLFVDRCPFCTNPKYWALFDESLGNILDNTVFLEYGKCPKCGANRNEIVDVSEDLNWHNELVGCAGQRSSKSFLAALLALYVWHWYTKLSGSPSKYFGLHNTTLHMNFIALSFNQAKENLWDPFYNCMTGSPWFNAYHKFLKEKSKEIGLDTDSVFKLGEQFLVYKHKNLECSPAGPDKRRLRGPTRFFTAIDELGWFIGGKSAIKINPDEVYQALINSLKTLRAGSVRIRRIMKKYHVPTGYAINISSPSSARDKIMRLVYQSRKVGSMYSFHLPTWEMNPTFTKEDFADDFEKNALIANRDFGAFPPLSQSPFISDISEIWQNRSSRKNIFKYLLVLVENKAGKTYTSAILKDIKKTNKPMLMALDAGYSGNAFAIVCTSYSEGKAITEGVIEVKPIDKNPVNFIHLYNKVVKYILTELNIIAVFIDQWQSIDLMLKIEEDFDGEIEAVRYSPKYSDFDFVRQKLLGEQVILPRSEVDSWEDIKHGVEDYEEFFVARPIAHLFLQLATVQDSGKRLTKANDLDDDIFRALALCIIFTWEEEYKDRLINFEKEEDAKSGTKLKVRGYTVGSQKVSRTIMSKSGIGSVAGRSLGR